MERNQGVQEYLNKLSGTPKTTLYGKPLRD